MIDRDEIEVMSKLLGVHAPDVQRDYARKSSSNSFSLGIDGASSHVRGSPVRSATSGRGKDQ